MPPATSPSILTAVRSVQQAPWITKPRDSYTVTIAATDAGGLTTSQTVTLNVNDINEAPINVALTGDNVDENLAAGALVGTVSASDPDAGDSWTYAITDASGNFTIDPNSGEIRTTGALDHEAQDSYTVTIAATDAGGLTTSQTVTLNVNDINEAPVNVTLTGDSVDENLAAGTLVGTVSASDPDAGDSWTYSITDASGNFTIDPNSGEIRTTGALDHEAQDSYTVTIAATDAGGLTTSQTVTLNVNDINEAPINVALTGNDVDENLAAGALVGTVSASDPDAGDSWTYSITDASGNFTIDPNSGEIRTTGTLDHEAQDSYTVTIAATDAGGLTTSQTVTLNVNDINEAPVNVTLTGDSVDENLAAGTLVGTVSASDPDAGDSWTYSITDASGNFTIDPNSGEIRTTGTLDHEAQDSYTVTIAATDAGGLTTSQTVTLNVNDINEAPVNVALTGNDVDENLAAGALVGTVSASDPDAGDSWTYSITDASGNFTIDPNSGEIRTTGALDHEAQDSYTVTIAATDAGGLTTSQTVTLNVNDINEAPINVALTGDNVDENLAAGALVGTVSASDPDAGDSWTYAITDASGNFTIDPNSGEIRTTGALDHEAQDSYTVTIAATDAGGLTTSQTVTLNVNDINEAPINVALTGNDVDENLAAGALVGTVSASDPDAGDSWTYAITDASGNFTIDPNSGEIRTTGSLDHEAQDSYTVTIAATDAGGLTTSQTVTLNVNDINEAPVNVTLTGDNVDENLAAGRPCRHRLGVRPGCGGQLDLLDHRCLR